MLLDELETERPLNVPQLTRLHERNRRDPRYAHTLTEAVVSGSPALERAGGWLLRRWMNSGAELSAEEGALLIDGLDAVRSHVGRLMLYQLFTEHPELMETAPDDAAAFLRPGLDAAQATARAWSLSALSLLARSHPEHRADVRRALARARRDPEACVQARLRQMGLGPRR
ncbi:MAG TPA: hypothetical protein VHD62_17445 [Opitutaceae bacterium]|nr:hypothetical protein [Opitutaceae bacterium]